MEKIQTMYEGYRNEAFEGVDEITVPELRERMSRYPAILIDCREDKEIAVSRIPGAITKAEFEATPDMFKGKTIIAYCTIGYRSGIFAKDLQERGFKVKNLVGGVLMWAHDGHKFLDPDGKRITRVHVYGKEWDLLPPNYESVY